MKLKLRVRRIGRQRERVLLRRFVPLLRLLVFQAAFEVVPAFLGKSRQRHHQQAQDDNKRNDRVSGLRFHNDYLSAFGYLMSVSPGSLLVTRERRIVGSSNGQKLAQFSRKTEAF